MVLTVVAKDLNLYFRNRFFAFITVLGLVFYIAAYFLMPRTVDEELTMAIYAPVMPPALAEALAEEGVVLDSQPSEEALRAAVASGQYQVGVVLPPDMTEQIAAGRRPTVQLYFTADLPPEFGEVYIMFVRELAFLIGGEPLNIETQEEVLGPDMAGQQVPPRDRMLPLLAVFVLMMETLGMASLISSEVEAGTLQALLVTPLTVPGLFLGKLITGTGLAFVQTVLLMAVTGGLMREPLLILVTLLLGAVMVTGLAFLVASVARDFMSVIGWGILVVVLLAIPGISVLLPGLVSGWIRLLPSHYLVDAVRRVVNFGAGWGEVASSLVLLAASAAVFVGVGMASLRRRFA
ncbi:MAG: ABC transporter permease [Anaerolineae bacterium]|nr:ABC transporter permease [Anaerolineae bacterium]